MINIKTDSRKVISGDTFVAIKGNNFDGHNFVEEVIKKGAIKIIAEHGEYSVETLIVDNTKTYLATYLKDNYYNKIKDIKLIGITGTNGKTTSAYLLYQSLRYLGKKSAYIGTIGFFMDEKVYDSDMTTPELLELYNILLKCKQENIEYVVMEVSSHAIDKKRIDTLLFDQVIFTNLTKDHLDFHITMDNYAKTKSLIFNQLKKDGYAIINSDDQYFKLMIKDNNNVFYGMNEISDYKIIDFMVDISNTNFTYEKKDNTYNVYTKLLGRHNMYNLLTAIISLEHFGFNFDEINKIIKYLSAPDGRMDVITWNNKYIIVDYAHTPDAVLNCIKTIKEFSKGKIYSIIGCGGNRDKDKRPIMAHIATTLSDLVIITSDNPREEDEEEIISDMITNLGNTNYIIVVNRKEAILKGFNMLCDNDILLIMGKGHESYQIIKNKRLYHNDKEYVLELINKR